MITTSTITLKENAPVRFYGPAALMLPIGFHLATTKQEQIDILYDKADNPETPRFEAEWLLSVIRVNLLKGETDA